MRSFFQFAAGVEVVCQCRFCHVFFHLTVHPIRQNERCRSPTSLCGSATFFVWLGLRPYPYTETMVQGRLVDETVADGEGLGLAGVAFGWPLKPLRSRGCGFLAAM